MNICKVRFNTRTKSLREKFSHKRSYSELSFKNAIGNRLTTDTSGSVSGHMDNEHGSSENISNLQINRPEALTQECSRSLHYSNESYCSAMDITGEPQSSPPINIETTFLPFIWQHDIGIQCDLIKAPKLIWPASTVATTKKPKEGHRKLTHNTSSTLISTLKNFTDTGNGVATGSGNRFWKSSTSVSNYQQQNQQQNFSTKKCSSRWASNVGPTLLKRAASFNDNKFISSNYGSSSGGYSRLVQSTSSPSSPEMLHDEDENRLKVLRPTSFILDPVGNETGALSWWAPPTASRNKQTKPTTKSMKDLTLSPSSKPVSKMGKQKRKYLTSRKQQPSSAPDSFDDSTSTISVDINIGSELQMGATMPTAKSVTTLMATNKLKKLSNKPLSSTQQHSCSTEHIHSSNDKNNFENNEKDQTNNNNELYSFDIVNRLMNISLQSSQNKNNEQKIPSAPFLLNLPDNSPGNSNGYLNLPSPNIQSEIQDINPVLRKLSVLQRSPERILQIQKRQQMEKKSGKFSNSASCMTIGADNDFLDDTIYRDNDDNNSEDDEELATLNKNRSRRRALVPPKLIADDHSDGDSRESEPNQCQNMDSKNMDPSDSSSVSPPLAPKPISPDVTVQIIAPDGNVKHNISDSMGDLSIPIINQPTDYDKQNRLTNETNDSKQNLDDNKSDDSTTTTTMETQNSSCSNQTNVNNTNINNNLLNVTGSNNKNRRRSSVVVIPPMQICPGDLLVYSKVLTQRSNLIEGTLAANLVSENQRKSKNSWNLLRLFDRSNRSKMEQLLCGLEEYLANLPISNSFVDETLLEYREISWQEFELRIRQRQQTNMPDDESIESSSTANESIINSHQTIILDECKNRRPSRYGGARFSSFDSMSTTTTIASLPPVANCVHCGNCYSTLSTMQQLQQPTDVISKTVYNLGSGKPDDGNLEQKIKPKFQFQRTDSVNTESEVESIVDQEMPPLDIYSIPDPEQVTLSPTNIIIDAASLNVNNEMPNVNNLPTVGLCRECRKQKKRLRRQYEALWYLFQSELFFLTNHLMVLKNVFMEPLKNIQVEGYAMFAEPEVLFGNLDELCLLTYAFCKKFLNLLIRFAQQKPEWIDMPGPEPASTGPGNGSVMHVGTILNKLYLKNNRSMSTTQAYHRYTLNYINALQYLETLRRQMEFNEFEKWCNRDPRCKKLQLTDLLVAPVQHIMRVPLLLKEIEAKTIDPIDQKIISDIIDQQELSLRELDDKMRWLKNFERLLEIQRNIIWPSVLDMEPKIYVPDFLKSFVAKQPCERLIASPRRQVILEGSLTIMDSGKPVEMYVFLFDDLFLITRRKKSLGKKQSTLTERWISNCGARTGNFPVTGSTGATCTGSTVPGAATGTGAASSSSPGGTAAGATGSNPAQPVPGSTGQATAANPAAASSSAAVHTSGSGPNPDHLIMMTGEPNHGPLTGNVGGACFKYLVYKQPLSLDRFYIHDVPQSDRLKNAFVLVCLNRFQQVVTIHTFQAASESAKSIWLTKLRSTCDRWKHLLHNNNTMRTQATTNQHGSGSKNHASTGNKKKSDQTIKINGKSTRPQQSASRPANELDNKNDEQNRPSAPTQPKRSSLDSLTSVEASVSYQLNDSQMTTSTFT